MFQLSLSDYHSHEVLLIPRFTWHIMLELTVTFERDHMFPFIYNPSPAMTMVGDVWQMLHPLVSNLLDCSKLVVLMTANSCIGLSKRIICDNI